MYLTGVEKVAVVRPRHSQDSRETQAWSVARERLMGVAQTLVAPDRFETVFSRVMCLIPPE